MGKVRANPGPCEALPALYSRAGHAIDRKKLYSDFP